MRRGLSPAALVRVTAEVAPEGRVVRVRPLRGGLSSSVHVVHIATPGGSREAVVVRRYGAYWLTRDPIAAEREFRLLEVLSRLGQPVPRPLCLDTALENNVFGAPTVVMTRLPGRAWLSPADVSDYLDQMARALVSLHALPVDEMGFLNDQQVNTDRALGAENTPNGDELQEAVWSEAQRLWPLARAAPHRHALVHGDYWPGNLLWQRHRLVGIVDWEQPRLGDPTKDVATARGDISVLFGLAAADEFAQRYLAAGGAPLTHPRFWDLLISTWATREIEDWATVYPVLGRPELTPAMARERIRAFAAAALATQP